MLRFARLAFRIVIHATKDVHFVHHQRPVFATYRKPPLRSNLRDTDLRFNLHHADHHHERRRQDCDSHVVSPFNTRPPGSVQFLPVGGGAPAAPLARAVAVAVAGRNLRHGAPELRDGRAHVRMMRLKGSRFPPSAGTRRAAGPKRVAGFHLRTGPGREAGSAFPRRRGRAPESPAGPHAAGPLERAQGRAAARKRPGRKNGSREVIRVHNPPGAESVAKVIGVKVAFRHAVQDDRNVPGPV